MSNRLEPREALSGPLYLVAALLILVPTVDFLLSVPPAQFANVQWRFATVGLLSGHLLMPILGFGLAFVISAVLEQPRVQRVLVILCLLMSLALLVLSAGFVLDVMQVRASIPLEGQPAFSAAWTRAILKLVLSFVAFGFLGWRARRMIPATSRHRAPKPVHVVSK